MKGPFFKDVFGRGREKETTAAAVPKQVRGGSCATSGSRVSSKSRGSSQSSRDERDVAEADEMPAAFGYFLRKDVKTVFGKGEVGVGSVVTVTQNGKTEGNVDTVIKPSGTVDTARHVKVESVKQSVVSASGGGAPRAVPGAVGGSAGSSVTMSAARMPSASPPPTSPLHVRPKELTYYTPQGNNVQTPSGSKSWKASHIALLVVTNPTPYEVPKVKVRVSNLDFLVRPTTFRLEAHCKYFPVLVRVVDSHQTTPVKIQFVEDLSVYPDAAKLKRKPFEAKVHLKSVPGKAALKGTSEAHTQTGFTVFHPSFLHDDHVRYAVENTGIRSIAADFLGRGISFKRVVVLSWVISKKCCKTPGIKLLKLLEIKRKCPTREMFQLLISFIDPLVFPVPLVS